MAFQVWRYGRQFEGPDERAGRREQAAQKDVRREERLDNTFENKLKHHMHKFNGVPKKYFGLYLKECEWRFNTPDPKRQ